jgi:hypothetical protein
VDDVEEDLSEMSSLAFSSQATDAQGSKLFCRVSSLCIQPEIVRKVADSAHNIVNIY